MTVNLAYDNRTNEDIPAAWTDTLQQLLQLAADMEGVRFGEVALSFVTDEEIQSLNDTYRNISRPTDVLSFPMDDELPSFAAAEQEPDMLPMLGDIIISVPAAERQSQEYGHGMLREIGFLFVHGFLHLIGYDHQTAEDEATMIAKQEAVLEKAGLSR